MKRTEQEVWVNRFCISLKHLLELNYCMGAASENEIRAAAIDYLQSMSQEFANNITDDTFVPARR